ncbi:MAG: thiolase family protein [Bdellovibrionales bacterium]|jgi:acetyl-CoA acyltransferase|nr:thiolase family protein [Bdellovibrionales bacterium]
MNDCYIVYAKRTPIGKINGTLSHIRVDDLMKIVLEDFKENCDFNLSFIDDVLIGCTNQAGEDNRNLARMSLLLAGFPEEVPGSTFNRLCGSSLDTVMGAFARISSGLADCIIAGGAESMSRAPYVLSKADKTLARNQKLIDSTFGWRFENPKMKNIFPLLNMGQTAEEIQKKYKISREDQDNFALNSHLKALKAIENGDFNNEIIPINDISVDECIRKDSSLEKLSKLKAVFSKEGTITAGNSSPMNDGASAVCVVSEAFMKKHNLIPIAKITGATVKGVHPTFMGLGPIVATKELCKKFNYSIEDFDIIELNEAFAVQALACIQDLNLDISKVNPKGGAIAIGHPLGCSGTRILTSLIHSMKSNPNLKHGLATMCIGVGQGIAISLENYSK